MGTETRPLLRGWLHLVCFFLAIPVSLVVLATATSATARVAAAVYGLGVIAMFGVSGSYHRGRWSPTWRARMQRLDHTTIFVMIAGSYTPVCLLVLDGWVSVVLLAVVWVGAVVGGVLAWTGSRRVGALRYGLYIALGWAAVMAGPQMIENVSATDLALLAIGGMLFTIGAIFLATHWPDPFPRVFGYHEVWHALVVAAVICQMVAIVSVIHNSGSA